MTEQALHLLERVAEDQAIAFHRPRRHRRLAQPLLDQQGEHMDRIGVTELMRADRERGPARRASLASTGEDRLPRVRAHRLPDLGQP